MDRVRIDVFLSHNSADKPAVEELAQRLRAVGLEPWLDKWNLVSGDSWQPALEEALRDSAACVVVVADWNSSTSSTRRCFSAAPPSPIGC